MLSDEVGNGHSWTNVESDKCELCGDKDWMADKYCAGNSKVAEQRMGWLEELRQQENETAGSAS